ncbi:RNA-binding protein 34-like [Ptychodera flava]|uniref:RNA-binding protein 34-like n=1 Tax=Ptychodera flava TaxID=63121 RepID=UPI003969EA2D
MEKVKKRTKRNQKGKQHSSGNEDVQPSSQQSTPFGQYAVGGIASLVSKSTHTPRGIGISEKASSTKSSKLEQLFGQSQQPFNFETASSKPAKVVSKNKSSIDNIEQTEIDQVEAKQIEKIPDSSQLKLGKSSRRNKLKQSQVLLDREQGLRNADKASIPTKRKKKQDNKDDDEIGFAKHKEKKVKPSPRNPEQDSRTIFVGNVPVSITKKDIMKLFGKFGEIESMRLRSAAPSTLNLPKKVIMIQKDFHPDRSGMNVYVVFKEEKSARKALKCNGKEFRGHHLRVDLSSNTDRHDHRRSIFVGNLPYEVEEETVRGHFEQCGSVQNVRLVRDGKTGMGKGFGYVLFTEPSSVEFALKLNEKRLSGRPLRVKRSVKKEKRKCQIRLKGELCTENRNVQSLRGETKRTRYELKMPTCFIIYCSICKLNPCHISATSLKVL